MVDKVDSLRIHFTELKKSMSINEGETGHLGVIFTIHKETDMNLAVTELNHEISNSKVKS